MRYSEIFSFVFAVLLLCSCEKKDLKESDIGLVPVYNISNIQGEEAPFSIDLYIDDPLVIVYPNANQLEAYEIADYVDDSTASEYDFSFVKSVKTTTEEDNNEIYAVETYQVKGEVGSNSDIMIIKSINGNGNSSTKTYAVTIKKIERYR